MKRVAKFQAGGDVAMTAAERRRQNIERINQRRATNRMQAAERAEIERFNERLRQGTLTADDMRRMGAEAPQRQAAPAPSMRDVVRPARPGEAPRRPADAMRDAVRPVGPSAGRSAPRGPGIAGAAGTLLGLGPAAMEAYNAYRNRPITGEFERSMDPEGSNEAADAERERQASQPAPARPAAPAPRSQPARRQAPRRNVDPEGTQAAADAERERQRGDIQPREPNLDERIGAFMDRNLGQIGLRRTNETGEGAPSTGSLRGDLQALGRALGFKKGGMVKPKKYQEGGPVKVPGKKPAMGGPKAPATRMRDMISPEERRELDAPLTRQELDRMRESGFKKGGAVKPKTAMKKGGAVKAPAKKMKSGGKVPSPKKMTKGGMTSKPKKMMGGGRAMYAKGGMARGCK